MNNYKVSTTSEDAIIPLGLEETIYTYTTSRPIEYVSGVGILTYIDGATYPRKCNPTPEAVHLNNIIKKLILTSLKHPVLFLFTSKNKLITSFNIIFDQAFSSCLTRQEYRLQEQYLCVTAHAIMQFTNTMLKALNVNEFLAKQFAYNIAHVFEYDDAYRLRIQDILSEMDYEQMVNNPRKEIKRLLLIVKQREDHGHAIFKKINHIISIVLLILLVPKYKKAFIVSAPHLKNMVYDDADRYWACLKGDTYKFTGRTYEERTKGLQIPQVVRVDYK